MHITIHLKSLSIFSDYTEDDFRTIRRGCFKETGQYRRLARREIVSELLCSSLCFVVSLTLSRTRFKSDPVDVVTPCNHTQESVSPEFTFQRPHD